MSYYRASNEFKGYANSFQDVARLGLKSIKTLLKYLGNPHEHLRFIHVAGTNGKGSVCAFLAAMLTHSGYKTGLFTSPNMIKVNERINIDGCDISDGDMELLLEEVEQGCRKTEKEIGLRPTQFETWTAMGFLYFAKNKCDIVVLETGLGGRLDATNVVQTTDVAVIAHIALDHTKYLGDTIGKIAAEKCGIIKPGVNVVSALQQAEAMEVIKRECKERGCRLYIADKTEPDKHEEIYEIINTKSIKNTRLSLGGINQIDNALCAVCVGEVIGLCTESIKFGLENAKNMGRMEKIDDGVYFDGAHNPDGVYALKKNIERYFPQRDKIFIMATMEDKDFSESLRILNDKQAKFYMVAVEDNPRSMSAEKFAGCALEMGLEAKAFASIREAYNEAKQNTGLIIICGSLYLYKDFMSYCR